MRDRDLTEKRCNGCGITKPVSDFYWKQRRWSSLCRPCTIDRNRTRRLANLEAARARERETERRLKDVRRNQKRARYLAHRDDILARGRQKWPLRAKAAAETARAWRAENAHVLRDIHMRRRARLASAPLIERIDRAAIIARDNSTCYLCETPVSGRSLTLDHLTPLCRGGDHTAANLRVCCRSCNSKKRHLTLPEYLDRLLQACG